MEEVNPKYMMATKAFHGCREVTREEDICYIYAQNEENYIGSWVTGIGMIDVYFPIATTRELTESEKEEYRKTKVRVSNSYEYSLQID